MRRNADPAIRPVDDLSATGLEILEPVARAFVDAARKIVERGEAAFKQ